MDARQPTDRMSQSRITVNRPTVTLSSCPPTSIARVMTRRPRPKHDSGRKRDDRDDASVPRTSSAPSCIRPSPPSPKPFHPATSQSSPPDDSLLPVGPNPPPLHATIPLLSQPALPRCLHPRPSQFAPRPTQPHPPGYSFLPVGPNLPPIRVTTSLLSQPVFSCRARHAPSVFARRERHASPERSTPLIVTAAFPSGVG
jgi:hypothetical protein